MTLQKLYFDDFIYTEDTIVVAVATLEKEVPVSQKINNLKLVLFDTFIFQNNEYVVTDDQYQLPSVDLGPGTLIKT